MSNLAAETKREPQSTNPFYFPSTLSFPRRRESGGQAKLAIRNQARTAASGSLPPLWGKARMGVPRAFSPRPGTQTYPCKPRRLRWGVAGV